MDIENELKKFNVTDSAIAELTEKYMPLAVNGIDDKEGLKAVNAARKIVKTYRIDVDKRRKELNADALEYQRRINGEAKRITALLEPIETHLESQEKKVDDEIERIKREKEEAEAARFKLRVTKLTFLRFVFDGVHYYSTYLDTFNNEVMKVSVLLLKQMTDEVFNDFYDNAKHYFEIEEKAIAEKKARDDAERKALAEERARLDAIAKKQAEKDVALKAEADRIDNLKAMDIAEKIKTPLEYKTLPIKKSDGTPLTANDLAEGETRHLRYTGEHLECYTEAEEKAYNSGFDFAINLVINHVNDSDLFQSGEGKNIGDAFKDELLEEVELYKKDG